MKKINLEEILWDSFRNNGIPKPTHSLAEITQKAVKQAMKEACRQALELAAENSQIPYLEHGMTNLANRSKQSILNIIKEIEP